MTDPANITRWCHHCEDGIDLPNKGLGRAYVAAWTTRHQGHVVTASREELPDDATWKVTCSECGEHRQAHDLFDSAFEAWQSGHTASHTTGPFDRMTPMSVELVTLTDSQPSTP